MFNKRRRLQVENRFAVLMALLAVGLALGALALQPPVATLAQNTATCGQILPEVQKRLISCSSLDRDQVCYGNPAVIATFADPASQANFSKVGDVIDLSALKTLQTAPLNLERNEWGIAALKVQVSNLDGTATGQAVTFVLFGDTTVTNATPASAQPTVKSQPPPACGAVTSRLSNLRNAPANGAQSVKVLPANVPLNISGRLADGSWLFADDTKGQTGWVLAASIKPSCDVTTEPVIDPNVPTQLSGLRAFYFSTAVQTQSQCRDVPQGGFIVRSPTGRKVEFTVDGTDISMGSTVEFMKVGNQLIIVVLDGEIVVTVNGQSVTVRAGQQLTVKTTGDPPQAVGPLPNPQPAQNPASQQVRCAVDPVINYGCVPVVPNNLTITAANTGESDTVLRPDGGGNTVNGPKPPPKPGPSGPGSPPACFSSGAPCSSNAQCCSNLCYSMCV